MDDRMIEWPLSFARVFESPFDDSFINDLYEDGIKISDMPNFWLPAADLNKMRKNEVSAYFRPGWCTRCFFYVACKG